jgi:hypothetical protein
MAMKGSGTGDLTVVDRFDGGVGWIAYPDETMQRASHAVESDGGLWLVDPVDVEGLDDLLAEYADPEGVVVLLDRHKRDAAAIATRHDVPVYVPEWMDGVVEKLDAPTRRFDRELADFDVIRLINNPLWQEAVLFDGETLVVPEALGTADYFRAAEEPLGVHPMLRLFPPRALRSYDPDRLLVGHGDGIDENVGRTIRRAIDGSRRNAMALYAKSVRELLGGR